MMKTIARFLLLASLSAFLSIASASPLSNALISTLQQLQQQNQQSNAGNSDDGGNAGPTWTDVGIQAVQQVDSLNNSNRCMNQCLVDLKARLAPGQTKRCRDDGGCSSCITQCSMN